MRRTRAATAALLGAALCATAARAQAPAPPDAAEAEAGDAPTVAASIDRTEAHVGDQLTLTVTAIASRAVATTVRLPRPELRRFEVLDSSQADRDLGDGKTARRFVLQIAAYEVGDLEIPPLSVEYDATGGGTRALRTAAIPVTVRRLVDEAGAEMQPAARTHEVMIEDRRPLQALAAAGAVLLLAIAAWVARALLGRRRRQVVAPEPATLRPPEELALERLRALRQRGRFDEDGFRPFHFELAEVVRGYLGARFGFDSLELTTTELLGELERGQRAERQAQRHLFPVDAAVAPGDAPLPAPAPAAPAPPPLLDDDLARVRRFLGECDLVKFAKAPSSDGAAIELLDEAEAIVRSTTAIAAAATLGPASLVARG